MEINKEYLAKIREALIEKVFKNPEIMFNDIIRGDDDDNNYIDLIEIITDLYELLHIQVEKEPYDYMFHWANKIGSWVETGNFLKSLEDNNKT